MKAYGWGFGDTEPINELPPGSPGEPLRGVGSGHCADVPGFSTTNGLDQKLKVCAPAAIVAGALPYARER